MSGPSRSAARSMRSPLFICALVVVGAVFVPAGPVEAEGSLRAKIESAAAKVRADAAAAARATADIAGSAKDKATKAAQTARTIIRVVTNTPPTTAPSSSGASSGGGPTGGLPPAPTGRVYSVNEQTLVLVDPSRPTEASGTSRGRPTRTLETTIWYPVSTEAEPDLTFPLVVFGHGLGARPAQYAELLRLVASSGYVVAAPRFPVSTNGARNIKEFADRFVAETEQPGDMSFVMTQVIDLAGRGSLPVRIDAGRVGVAGHSLGAVTVFDLAFNDCCFDARVKAAIAISGGLNVTRSKPFFRSPAVPLLLIHGDKDAVVPYSLGSVLAFASAGSPKAILTVVGGDHTFGLKGRPDSRALIGSLDGQAMIAFLDRYLKGDAGGTERLAAVVASQPTLLRLDSVF